MRFPVDRHYGRSTRRVQPRLWVSERLEDRVLLSGNPTVYTVDLTSADGAGSNSSGDLVFVIKQANGNTNPAGSEIRFDPAVFSTPKTITLSSTLELSEPVGPEVVDGPGASLVTISGNKKVGVFQVDQGVTATIAGLTISGGSAEFGAGIYDKGILTVDSSTISNNVATGPGGGIYILGQFYFVEVTVNSSTIASNSAVTGGGIQNDSGILNVSGSLISGNSADFGGGIYNTGTGGNPLLGTATVTTCTISGNSANPTDGYGGGIDNSGIMHVTSSTISSNTADIGGGILIVKGDTLILADTTIAGNTAQFNKNATALTGLGGGIEDEGALTAVNCTIAYNNGGIGGLDLSSGSTATLDNTIVALNTFEVSSGPKASDIYSFGGTVSLASASNLIGTGGSGGLTNGSNGNLIGVANPLLGALANNGGPTSTIALLPGSPAIAAGSIALAVYPVTGQPITTDQRGAGYPRIFNNTVDIGAFEFQGISTVAKPTPTFTPTPTSTSTRPPTIIGEQVLTRRKTNKLGKPAGKPTVEGFVLEFSTAMNPASAGNPLNYQVDALVKHRRKSVFEPVELRVVYDSLSNSVELLLAVKQTFPKGGQITVIASPPSGVTDSAGQDLDGNDENVAGDNGVFTILTNARGITR